MRRDEPLVILLDEPNRLFGARRQPAGFSRLSSPAVGLTATVFFHLLVSAPLILGFSARKVPPRPDQAPGSVAWSSEGNQRESMVLLDLSALTASEFDAATIPDMKSEGIEIEELALAFANAKISPPPEIQIEDSADAESSSDPAGDPAGAAALYGRYMGQIASRIERAWMRPRLPVEGGRFDCHARIAQDRRGRVLSIEYLQCGGDAAWRESLKSAIMRSSPLSAPPEQWLFAETITLSFSADQYVANKTPEYLYEPPVRKLARSTIGREMPALPDAAGDLELTIEGSEVKWRKMPSVSKDK
jgi:hypothetical protein